MIRTLMIITIAFSGLTGCGQNGNQKAKSPYSIQKDSMSFDEQLKVFNSLGYHLNKGITREFIFKEIKKQHGPETDAEKIFTDSPFSRLYFYLGWRYESGWSTNNCIWYDIEFIDPNTEYISFMKRMGEITSGEINYSDIKLLVDKDQYEWLEFKVNGIYKKWKLAKVNHTDDSFFQRFSYLTKELNTKGRYTYYDDGGQQFVIDYATPEKQEKFIQATGLKREWLGEGNHFTEPKE